MSQESRKIAYTMIAGSEPVTITLDVPCFVIASIKRTAVESGAENTSTEAVLGRALIEMATLLWEDQRDADRGKPPYRYDYGGAAETTAKAGAIWRAEMDAIAAESPGE